MAAAGPDAGAEVAINEVVADEKVTASTADPIAAILDDPQLAQRLRDAGRARAATWPDEDDTVEQVRAIYRELMAR